jgi:hypothetical protein
MIGWSDHTMAGICRFIDEDYQTWLDWPVEQARRLRQEKDKGRTTVDARISE